MRRGRSHVATSPAQARALAECALAVAGRLDGSYPAVIRAGTVARAWTSMATVDCQDGDPHASLKALERADDALRGQPALAHDVAMTDVVRATALQALGRHDEALALLRGARQRFDDFGDARRRVECEERIAGMGGSL